MNTMNYIEYKTTGIFTDNLRMLQVLEEMKKLDITDFSLLVKADRKDLYITINDFEGFDDDYNAIDRVLENEDSMDEFFEYLENNCDESDFGLSDYYYINDWTVIVERESANI